VSASGKVYPSSKDKILSGRDGESNTNSDRWKLTAKAVYRSRVGNPAYWPSIKEEKMKYLWGFLIIISMIAAIGSNNPWWWVVTGLFCISLIIAEGLKLP
jgi:hypothetical protein